jgi:hypothetical protein
MTEENYIYKSTFPPTFYLIRGALIGGLILICLIFKDNYLIMAICAYLTFMFSLNNNNYVIEVYKDHFKILLPSFYGNKFTQIETYYFKDISNFEFSKGYYDIKAAVFGELVRTVLPGVAIGALFAYQEPTLIFIDKTYINENISYRFKSNRESLEKGIKLAEERLKKTQS